MSYKSQAIHPLADARGINDCRSSSWTSEPVVCGAAGALLVGLGVRFGSLPGFVLAAVGGGMLYKAATCAEWESKIARSLVHPPAPETTVAASEIDEAAWESFPASDPPSFTRTTS